MNREARWAARGADSIAASPTAGTAPSNRSFAAAGHFNRGKLHFEHGRLAEAMECYLRAIEIVPDYMDAHINFCAVLIVQSRFAEAAAHCERILAHDPALVAGYNHLAVAHLGAGDAHGALDAVRRGLKISETAEGKSLFALCLQNLRSVPDDGDLRELIVRAMSEPWGRPGELAGHCIDLIKADEAIASCIDRAAKAWPERLAADQLFGVGGLPALARSKILQCLLENARGADVALERLLTATRCALLDAATSASGDELIDNDVLGFFCALARQCFINEYVFVRSDEELERAGALRERLSAALHDNSSIAALWPVAVAAYQPLHVLDESEKLSARSWPAPVDALLTQQVREPNVELHLRAAIPQLTPVEDEISLLVQRQYEENPYPRWVKAPRASKPLPVNQRLQRLFPFAEFRALEKDGKLDVLVAGCGTGQQLVDVASRFADANVLAIDLSLASLAYAKRQTAALQLNNIEFGRADILQLGALGRIFDIIDCGGVLHHLGDPLAGWRVLLGLLRPGGVMRIALYSELARADIVAAQEYAAMRGYGATPDDIRRFRQDLIAASAERREFRAVLQFADFFSTSDCRDLLFHAQEHRFTLPQIEAFLAENDLQFLGFEADPALRGQYTARFPDDPAMTDLDRWHAFERQTPRAFIGMYQFWVQKRA